MKKRLLYYDISKHIDAKEAIVVTGMRQVGKTTLLRQVFDSLGERPKLWFDFENPLDQKLFEDIEYRNVYRRLSERASVKDGERIFVFLDEIQNFPEVTKVMKYCIDHYGVKFFVTGSSNFYLRNLFPESLSGRKFLFVLPPLSFGEYLYFRDKVSLDEAQKEKKHLPGIRSDFFLVKERETEYDRYLRFGGFPAVAFTDDEEMKRLILKNIFASFFEKDLAVLSDYTDVRELRDLILLLVPRVGSLLDITKISRELGVDRRKVYGYLEFLQGVFFLKLLPKFSKSIDRSVAGGRKIYFSDTGLLSIIGSVTDGQLFENAVINQLGGYGTVSFYHLRNTAEIDAILDGTLALEIKVNGTEQDARKLVRLSGKLGIPEARIISRDVSEHSDFLPGSLIL